MHEPMEATIRHAKFLAKYLNNCSEECVIRIALKETGMRSSQDGFRFAMNAAVRLCGNPYETLRNGVYIAVGRMRQPVANQDEVESSLRFSIRTAWKERCVDLWNYYFPEGLPGSKRCPSNRDYLMALVDFVELWKDCCEEVNYERT